MSAEIDNEQAAEEQKTGLPGTALKKARQEKGLKPEDIAGRLNLEVRVITDLEADDYTRLPEPTYIRGYILAYAKLLDLPEPVLEPFDQYFDLHSPLRSTNTASFDLCGQDGWVKCVNGGLIILLVIAVGLWFVENSFHLIQQMSQPQPDQSEETPESLVDNSLITETTDHGVGMSATVMDLEEATIDSQNHAAEMPEDSLTDGSTAIAIDLQQHVLTQSPESTLPLVDDLAASADQSEPARDATTADVVLAFKGSSWVKVNDVDGELRAGTFDDGQRIELNGVAPIEIILGKPENVELTYKGRSIDLTPYYNKVARLTLDSQIE